MINYSQELFLPALNSAFQEDVAIILLVCDARIYVVTKYDMTHTALSCKLGLEWEWKLLSAVIKNTVFLCLHAFFNISCYNMYDFESHNILTELMYE